MESLEIQIEKSLSINDLKAQRDQLGNERMGIDKKLEFLNKEINKKQPSLKECLDKKRKIEVIDEQELKSFAELLLTTFPDLSSLENQSSTDDSDDDNNREFNRIKKTRKVYTKEIKGKAIELVKVHGVVKVAEKCNIPDTNLKCWIKDSDAPSDRKRGRPIKHPSLETELIQFIKERRTAHKAITSRIVVRKAKTIAERLKITDMKFRWSWFVKFLRRNSLSLRAPTTRIKHNLKELTTVPEAFIEKFQVYLNDRNIFESYFYLSFLS